MYLFLQKCKQKANIQEQLTKKTTTEEWKTQGAQDRTKHLQGVQDSEPVVKLWQGVVQITNGVKVKLRTPGLNNDWEQVTMAGWS